MQDRTGNGSGAPATFGFLISPSDNQYLPVVPRAVYVGGSGNVAVLLYGGDVVIFVGAVAGTILPIRPAKVFSTSTTATNLVGLY